MERFLVAFEAPDALSSETYEARWDAWVGEMHSRGLQLVSDLDPVAIAGDIQVFEVVSR